MKKKYIVVATVFVVLLLIVLLFIFNNNKIVYGNNAFYLESNLYNTKDNYEEINVSKFNNLINNKKSFIVFTYASFCPFSAPSDKVFKSVFEKNNMKLYAIGYDKLNGNDITNKVSYAPSVMIFKKGKLVAYLDAEKDEDYNRYQNKKEFRNWLSKYVYLKLNLEDN